MAEKQQIMETAIFGGYSGLTAPIIIFFCILSPQKSSFKKWAGLRLFWNMAPGSLQTAKLQVGNWKMIKKWSNNNDLTIHRILLLLKNLPQKFFGL